MVQQRKNMFQFQETGSIDRIRRWYQVTIGYIIHFSNYCPSNVRANLSSYWNHSNCTFVYSFFFIRNKSAHILFVIFHFARNKPKKINIRRLTWSPTNSYGHGNKMLQNNIQIARIALLDILDSSRLFEVLHFDLSAILSVTTEYEREIVQTTIFSWLI